MSTIITASVEYAEHNGHECDILMHMKKAGGSRMFVVVNCECGAEWLIIPAKNILVHQDERGDWDYMRKNLRPGAKGDGKPAIWIEEVSDADRRSGPS